jgi:hypothetical protein
LTIKFPKSSAADHLEQIIGSTNSGNVDEIWVEKISEFSRLCDECNILTHIAFLGVELLAKSIEPNVDLYYIKPTKAPDSHVANSYSARTLCHSVLVPIATKYDINLGATGAEPLNNQPYFRMDHLGDGTAVHGSSKPAWNYMLELVKELDKSTQAQAVAALGAFIHVRRNAGKVYVTHTSADKMTSLSLATALEELVVNRSENGKRAQAATAGIMDAVYGQERVNTGSGRINDPSRKRPGDVCVLRIGKVNEWEKALEVKDKPVSDADIMRFVRNGLSNYAVQDFGYLALAADQSQLDDNAIIAWAEQRGATVSIFYNWETFLRQSLFWAPAVTLQLTIETSAHVSARLQEIEASTDALSLWNELVSKWRTP